MQEGLTITKTEIILTKWNSDRCGDHLRRKKNDKCVIVNRKTQDVVFIADTVERADEWFYDVSKVNWVIPNLRTSVQIEPGVTLRDLINLINQSESLKVLTYDFMPKFNNMVEHTMGMPIDLVVAREGLVDSEGELTIWPACSSPIETVNWDSPIRIDSNFKIYKDGEIIFDGEYDISLLELLIVLFGKTPDELRTNTLGKTGLIGPNGIISDPISHLADNCIIEEGYSLGDLFKYMKQHPTLCGLIAQYSWCSQIDAFHADAKKPVEDDGVKLTRLTLEQGSEIYEYEGKKSIGLGLDIHGYGPLTQEDIENWTRYPPKDGSPTPEEQRYAIGMTRMYLIADLPLSVDDNMEITEFTRTSAGRQQIFKGIRRWTLLDIFDAIYWEISFYGGPEEAEEFRASLCEQSEAVKQGLEKTIPWEECRARLERETGYVKEVGESEE